MLENKRYFAIFNECTITIFGYLAFIIKKTVQCGISYNKSIYHYDIPVGTVLLIPPIYWILYTCTIVSLRYPTYLCTGTGTGTKLPSLVPRKGTVHGTGIWCPKLFI